ncbi:Ankrd54 [Symbiodinium sp. CCMP2456]|nr:Ankrd54 [Symbiodinium sp. CCMP2456]
MSTAKSASIWILSFAVAALATPQLLVEAQLCNTDTSATQTFLAEISFEGCAWTGFGTTPNLISFDELRILAEGFYESGHPLLNDYSLVERLLARKREVAAVCPFAVLQAMLLQSERLLVNIYRSSAESADVHAIQFSEASQLNLEFNLLQAWLQEQLRLNRSELSSSSKWPLVKGWRRVNRYYDLLWQDVYDSEEAWSRMEGEKSVSDEEYHKFFFDVVDTFEALHAEWWPCRGTLIAFLRHGARSGSLSSSKKKDVVDQDIDVMLGVEDEASFEEIGRSVENLLRKKGWDRCWTKSSQSAQQSAQSFETGALRRDLLYCVHTGPPYMMLDVTSYVTLSHTEPQMPYVFVHRVCEKALMQGLQGLAAGVDGRTGERCVVPPKLGPLQEASGGLAVLFKEAIYPFKKCKALRRSIPCPNKPLDTLIAMSHSGLSTSCIALPDTKGRGDDPFTRQLASEGLNSEDVRILQDRAQDLERQGIARASPAVAVAYTPPTSLGGSDGVFVLRTGEPTVTRAYVQASSLKRDSQWRRLDELRPAHTEQRAEASTTLVHLSGMCVKAQDDVTGEDSTVLVFSDCADEPAKNLHFEAKGGTYLFQLGRQCAHPDDSPEASSEPRLSFPADCSSNRHILSFQKLAEDEQLPGFLIQFVGGAVEYCIHPYQGSESPSDGTELINHVQCDRGRRALRFRVGDPEQLAKEEPQLKKALGNPLIPVPQEEPCSYFGEGKSQSSRPGKPCIPPPPFWPYTGVTEWRTELGRRILAAVTPTEDVSEAKCGGYFLLGDQTWCNRAFDGSHGYGQVGLSFGIEVRR